MRSRLDETTPSIADEYPMSELLETDSDLLGLDAILDEIIFHLFDTR